MSRSSLTYAFQGFSTTPGEGNIQRFQPRRAGAVTARKDAAPAACQAAISNVAAVMPFPGGGGLIQTTPGCRQQRVLRLHRRG